ncbi:putative surfeit locus protein 1 [Apostichopus japonicus]|uniref:SURF1-like protein n=1 Tax=Stichopus japonicus TaxID=307972 RepID=A0A2G8JRK5_STIJA|nr:putative surfeit locus protein 1 [Apostichopus japonicus]
MSSRLTSQQNGGSNQSSEGSMFGHLLLIMPAAAFGLGTWQVQRRKWKLNLIRELEEKVNADPIPLPDDITELEQLEYRKVNVQGEFDHSKEVYILPRSLNHQGGGGGGGGGFAPSGETGVHVITPFYVADKRKWILVTEAGYPELRSNPQQGRKVKPEMSIAAMYTVLWVLSVAVEGTLDLTGVVRLTERGSIHAQNDEAKNRWHYRDLEAMSKVTGTEPVMVDAVYDSTVKGGPIGGQTRVSLRNEHMQYIITWYSLALLTGVMWYYGIFKKRRNVLHRP